MCKWYFKCSDCNKPMEARRLSRCFWCQTKAVEVKKGDK